MEFLHRPAAFLLMLLVVFSVVFSAGFVASEIHHECCGEDCPICLEIKMCETTLKSVFTGLAPALGVLFFAAAENISVRLREVAVRSSLITLKVKLSD